MDLTNRDKPLVWAQPTMNATAATISSQARLFLPVSVHLELTRYTLHIHNSVTSRIMIKYLQCYNQE